MKAVTDNQLLAFTEYLQIYNDGEKKKKGLETLQRKTKPSSKLPPFKVFSFGT